MSEVHVFNIVVVFGLNMCSIKGKQLGLDCLRMGYRGWIFNAPSKTISVISLWLEVPVEETGTYRLYKNVDIEFSAHAVFLE